jgi:hypothetical protein
VSGPDLNALRRAARGGRGAAPEARSPLPARAGRTKGAGRPQRNEDLDNILTSGAALLASVLLVVVPMLVMTALLPALGLDVGERSGSILLALVKLGLGIASAIAVVIGVLWGIASVWALFWSVVFAIARGIKRLLFPARG